MQRVKWPAQNKIVRREEPCHRFSEHRNVGGALGQEFVQAVIQVSADDLESASSRFRERLEALRGRAKSVRVEGKNRERVILPFNNPVQGRPSRLRNV